MFSNWDSKLIIKKNNISFSKKKMLNKPGYANNNPSGTLIPNLMHRNVISIPRFPPAESPAMIIFFGLISMNFKN